MSNMEKQSDWRQAIEGNQLLRMLSPHFCMQNDLILIFGISILQENAEDAPFVSPSQPCCLHLKSFLSPIPTNFLFPASPPLFPKVAYLPRYPSLISINKINQSYNLLINNERNYDFYIIIKLKNCLTFTMKLANRLRHLFSSSKMSSQQCIQLEHDYGCNNYAPLPVVVESAQGIYVKDCEGKRYIDFLSAYSAVNQGHLHPKILKTFLEQAQKLTLTSRAVHSNLLGQAEMKLAKTFGYDKVLFMNTGVEAGQSAIKFARRWGYTVKNVEPNQATVLFAKGNFWGRTIAACASSDDPERYQNFGPFNGLNFSLVDYGSTSALEAEFQKNKNIVGFMVEPIQGEKGVVVPPEGYLRKVRELCNKYNVLLICDEIQTGLGRTGKLLCSTHDEVRPDLLLLGKALSGGFMPVSAVLCDNVIMDKIKPGEHGSTYGGNPLACAVTMTAVDVLIEEKMSENSAIMGDYLISQLRSTLTNSNIVKEIRGKGLFIGIEFIQSDYAYRFADRLVENGLIAKPTQRNIIRFSPPLIITKPQLDESLSLIQKSWKELIQ